MVYVVETKVYKFEELSDNAKNYAISKYELHDSWFDFTIEEFDIIAEMMGIDIKKRNNRFCVYFSGFYSQGDGASFEGRFTYKKGFVKEIAKYAPNDAELNRIAKEIFNIQRKYFYNIDANIYQSGHYCHSHTMQIDVNNVNLDYKDADYLLSAFRDFADWLYENLKQEYETAMDEKNISQYYIENEVLFYEDGSFYYD